MGETLLYALGDVSPFGEREVDFFWVLAFFPGDGAEEGYEVVGHVVLDGGAVADGVNVAQGCAVDAEMGVGFKGQAVILAAEFLGDSLAEL